MFQVGGAGSATKWCRFRKSTGTCTAFLHPVQSGGAGLPPKIEPAPKGAETCAKDLQFPVNLAHADAAFAGLDDGNGAPGVLPTETAASSPAMKTSRVSSARATVNSSPAIFFEKSFFIMKILYHPVEKDANGLQIKKLFFAG